MKTIKKRYSKAVRCDFYNNFTEFAVIKHKGKTTYKAWITFRYFKELIFALTVYKSSSKPRIRCFKLLTILSVLINIPFHFLFAVFYVVIGYVFGFKKFIKKKMDDELFYFNLINLFIAISSLVMLYVNK